MRSTADHSDPPDTGHAPAAAHPAAAGAAGVLLRRWSAADTADLAAAVAESDDLDRQLPHAALSGHAGQVDLVADLATWGPHDHHLAVVRGSRVVGTVAITGVETRHGTGWVSYWLTRSARGSGIATRAVATAAQLAFRTLGVERLELGHRVDNPGSCRVAAGAGFLPEGVERGKLRYGDRRFDVETHARLHTDPAPDVALLLVDIRG